MFEGIKNLVNSPKNLRILQQEYEWLSKESDARDEWFLRTREKVAKLTADIESYRDKLTALESHNHEAERHITNLVNTVRAIRRNGLPKKYHAACDFVGIK